MRSDVLLLLGLRRGGDAALAFARGLTGAFLVHGVWDNVTSPARMAEFAAFLDAHGFPLPALAAPFSVWTQFGAGLLLIAGVLTRWAGLVVVATFAVGIVMVHREEGFRAIWPAAALVALGLLFATLGAGRWSLDHYLGPR